MNYSEYKDKFIKKAELVGYSFEIIDRCLKYAQPLIESNLPVIYNFRHLASLVGYNTNYLLRVATHTEFFYREFKVPKKNKSLRTISEPLPSLKEIQNWILKEILYRVETSKFAKAYIPNSTIKQNVLFHRERSVVLTLDIANFFGSIKSISVRQIFNQIGYSHTLSNLMSKLCCVDDQIPQGASTSPYLSNLYLKEFDEKIGDFCVNHEIRYTRYADDLTFSGDFDTTQIVGIVKLELEILKLTLNDNKSKIMKATDRQIITGVVVNKKLQVAKTKRNELRQIMFYIKKYGVESHMERLGIKRNNYLEHILGKINFILFINQEDEEFKEYKNYLLKLKSQQ